MAHAAQYLLGLRSVTCFGSEACPSGALQDHPRTSRPGVPECQQSPWTGDAAESSGAEHGNARFVPARLVGPSGGRDKAGQEGEGTDSTLSTSASRRHRRRTPSRGGEQEAEAGTAAAGQCRAALESLADRFWCIYGEAGRAKLVDRTLSCHVPDIGVTYVARLGADATNPVIETSDALSPAQLRFTATSDEVLAIAEDPGSFGGAWLSGRLKVEGSVLDLLFLRTLI